MQEHELMYLNAIRNKYSAACASHTDAEKVICTHEQRSPQGAVMAQRQVLMN